MNNKVLVRLGHGYYKGGITPLPNVCPTIDAHVDCWHILIGENMKNEAVENYRIRKLTPKECGRLMGVRDDDIDKMSVNQSNSSLYHCFGDALVTTVMGAIFCNMMDTPLSFDEMIKSLYNSPNR